MAHCMMNGIKIFPFHNGSIETARVPFGSQARLLAFPFHNGSIETMRKFIKDSEYRDFHSTMVRLKLPSRFRGSIRDKFPFHNGSIETLLNPGGGFFEAINFHSTMVRLRPKRARKRALYRLISIPQWFD